MNTLRIFSLTIFMSLVIACGGTLDTTCTLPDGKIVEEGWMGMDPITNETQVCVWYCAGGTIYSEPEKCPPLTKTIAQTLETKTATQSKPLEESTSVKVDNATKTATAVSTPTPVPDPSSVNIHPTSCSSPEIGISKKWIETLESVNFTKCVRPFGVLIGAADGMPDVYIKLAAKIVAEILDPDMDGVPNDSKLFNLVSDYTVAWIPMPTDRYTWRGGIEDEVGKKLGSYGIQLPQWWMIGDEEFDDSNPDQRAKAVMVEEIIHFMTQFGYSRAYPEIFGVNSWDSLIAKETKRAACDWWQHPENNCPRVPSSVVGDCSEPSCDVTEFYHQVLVTRAGMEPGWLGIGFPTTLEELDLKLSPEMKEAMDQPKYNQINKPLVFSYPNRTVPAR